MSYDRQPDRITGPMTTSQAKTLRSLAVEAYQERAFQPDLSRAEAAKRISSMENRTLTQKRGRFRGAGHNGSH
jgi:hypothetical protein